MAMHGMHFQLKSLRLNGLLYNASDPRRHAATALPRAGEGYQKTHARYQMLPGSGPTGLFSAMKKAAN
jgi:hypothetical protein